MPAGDQLRPSGDRLVDDEDDPRVKLDGKGIIDDIDGQEEVKMMAEIKWRGVKGEVKGRSWGEDLIDGYLKDSVWGLKGINFLG